MKIIPTFDKVLIRLSSTEKISDGGIVLTDRTKQVIIQKAEVVALGQQTKFTPDNLKVGDIVLVNRYASSTEIDPEDKMLRVVNDTDILAVVGG